MADPRKHHAVALAPDGDLIVIGGATCGVPEDVELSTVERLDRESWTWSFVAEMPSPRRHHAALVMPDGAILVLGGETSGAVDRYDVEADAWSTIGFLPRAAPTLEAVVSADGLIVVKPTAGETWFVSSDGGTKWTMVPHGSSSIHASVVPDLFALPDGRVLATFRPSGATVFDPQDGTWWDQPVDPPWTGGAARLDRGEVIVMTTQPTPDRAPVGAPQLELTAALFDLTTGDRHPLGFIGCPPTSGNLAHLSATLYGAGLGRAVALIPYSFGAWFDRDTGWRRLAPLPPSGAGAARLLLDDGSFLVLGGATAEIESEGPCPTGASYRWQATE